MTDPELGTNRNSRAEHQPDETALREGAGGDVALTAAPQLARHHDPVTGLPDQLLFLDRIAKAIASGQRDRRLIAVMYLAMTEKPGSARATTDDLARAVTERLLANVRGGDTVARLGEREFGIIQQGLRRPVDSFPLCRRLQHLLAQPQDDQGRKLDIHMTYGVAVADQERTDPARCLRKAECALRDAQAEGPGICKFADPVHDAAWRAQQRAGAELRRALREGQLELRYLPMVRPADRHIIAFEALLRWNHPQRGLLAAGDFLGVAETCGLMTDIDDWAIRNACNEAAGWGCKALQVMVNVSLSQFRHGDLLATVDEALGDSGLDPSRLVIEITEDYILDEPERVLPVLHGLRTRGISITLDDFGTGVSSLGVLQSFPFDRIKIDQKLVAELRRQPVADTITRLVIAVGKAIGMRVTAEGVDSDHKLDFLVEHGCEEVQGFYFGRPLAPAQLRRLIDLVESHAQSPLWPPRDDDVAAA
jgi:EAL domain-containing protein (putative c-di-GMP-specific phosphodiesterase class I)/GGDEF domain-containing protein